MKINFSTNESKLIRLCQKGDSKAQYGLYRLYSKAMYNIALRMTGEKETAEDILQDSFIKAFSEIQNLKDEMAFGGWLKRIVINRCIDEIRKRKTVFLNTETIAEWHHNIEDEIEDLTDVELVHQLIKKLPDGAREILVLRALEGVKHAQISEKLGISESTAKTQFFRAKQLLAKMINALNNENENQKIFTNEQVES